MIKQLMLIEVAKTPVLWRERLKEIKAQHDIGTIRFKNPDESGWVALKQPPWITEEFESIDDLFGSRCGQLEDSGYLHEGKTEREAVRNLCVHLRLDCEGI